MKRKKNYDKGDERPKRRRLNKVPRSRIRKTIKSKIRVGDITDLDILISDDTLEKRHHAKDKTA